MPAFCAVSRGSSDAERSGRSGRETLVDGAVMIRGDPGRCPSRRTAGMLLKSDRASWSSGVCRNEIRARQIAFSLNPYPASARIQMPMAVAVPRAAAFFKSLYLTRPSRTPCFGYLSCWALQIQHYDLSFLIRSQMCDPGDRAPRNSAREIGPP
jgi:hypothetical protein